MTLAHAYARALFDLVSQGDGKEKTYLKNMIASAERRGYKRLLPNIFSEYELLALKETRSKAHHRTTKEQERTRVLLELYRTLTASHE